MAPMRVAHAAWPARFLIIGHATTLGRYRLQATSALGSLMGCCHGSVARAARRARRAGLPPLGSLCR